MMSIILLGGNEPGTLQAFLKVREMLPSSVDGKILFESDMIETAPEDDKFQANFFNSFVVVETNLNPFVLLENLQSLEIKLGRMKSLNRPKGPRVIDLDILFYEDICVGTELLQIPHPQVLNRSFVKILLKKLPSTYHQNLPVGYLDL